MNRRQAAQLLVLPGLMAMAPGPVSAAEPHNDRPSLMAGTIGTVGDAQVAAYRAYDAEAGVFPAGLRWMSAYAVICGDADTGETVAANLPRVIHDTTAARGKRGTIFGRLSYAEMDTPGGADQAEAWTWKIESNRVGMTVVRCGSWVQVLYGPSVDAANVAIDALTIIAASIMVRWPNSETTGVRDGGLWDALPAPDDLPEGVVVSGRELVRVPFAAITPRSESLSLDPVPVSCDLGGNTGAPDATSEPTLPVRASSP